MKVIKVTKHVYIFDDCVNKTICKSLIDLFVCCKNYGISFNEIEKGVMELERKEHDIIYFGDINRTFLFTSNSSKERM